MSSVFSSSSQRGMQALSTSGSFNLVHTASRGAASWTSPFIVMAMDVPPEDRRSFSQVKHARANRKGIEGSSDAYSHRNRLALMLGDWQRQAGMVRSPTS